MAQDDQRCYAVLLKLKSSVINIRVRARKSFEPTALQVEHLGYSNTDPDGRRYRAALLIEEHNVGE